MARASGNTKFKAHHDWKTSFLKRHPVLQRQSSTSFGTARYIACVPDTAVRWIRFVQSVYLKMFGSYDDVEPDRIWNFDETPFNPAPDGGGVIGERGTTARTVSGGYTSFFTVVTCVNAAGRLAIPLVIMDGTTSNAQWAPEESADLPEFLIDATPTHIINAPLFGTWLRRFADREKPTPDRPALIFLDNHSSHITPENILLAVELNIELCGLPPNTTNSFQPLDVAIFNNVKTRWRQELLRQAITQNFSSYTLLYSFPVRHVGLHGIVKKEDCPGLAIRALKRAIVDSPATTKSSFKKCGLVPLSLSALREQLPSSILSEERAKLHEAITAPKPTSPTVAVPPPPPPAVQETTSTELTAPSTPTGDRITVRFSADCEATFPADTPPQRIAATLGAIFRAADRSTLPKLSESIADVVAQATRTTVLIPRAKAIAEANAKRKLLSDQPSARLPSGTMYTSAEHRAAQQQKLADVKAEAEAKAARKEARRIKKEATEAKKDEGARKKAKKEEEKRRKEAEAAEKASRKAAKRPTAPDVDDEQEVEEDPGESRFGPAYKKRDRTKSLRASA